MLVFRKILRTYLMDDPPTSLYYSDTVPSNYLMILHKRQLHKTKIQPIFLL